MFYCPFILSFNGLFIIIGEQREPTLVQNTSYASRLEMEREVIGLNRSNTHIVRFEAESAEATEVKDHDYEYIPVNPLN